MSVPDYLKQWKKLAVSLGWSVTITRRRTHWRWTNPEGKSTFTSGSPGGARRENMRAQLRRLGLPI
jgi:hypothetical protein